MICNLPKMSPWPWERVSQPESFQYIGMEYLGPLRVKEGNVIIDMFVYMSGD